MTRGIFGPCRGAFVIALLAGVGAGRGARADVLSLTGLETFQEFYSSSTIPGDHFSHELGLGGPFVGSLDGHPLSSIYCVDIPRTINVVGNYTTTVTDDGTIHGAAVANAGAIAWLIAELGPSATTPDQLNALQAAIWRTEYGTAYQLDGADNGLGGNSATVIADYQADLAALGSNTLPVSTLTWLSPFNSDRSEAQGLAAVPEPSSLALVVLGLAAGIGRARPPSPRGRGGLIRAGRPTPPRTMPSEAPACRPTPRIEGDARSGRRPPLSRCLAAAVAAGGGAGLGFGPPSPSGRDPRLPQRPPLSWGDPGPSRPGESTTGGAAMRIIFRCAVCGRTASVPGRLAGRRGRCRACGNVQTIVGPADPAGEPSAYEVGAPAAGPSPGRVEVGAPTFVPARDESEAPAKAKRRSKGPDLLALFRAGAVEPSRVQGLAACLVALSAADIFMTFTLLRASPAFFEANPVARWFFARWNMAGMVAFKFSIIAGVIALAELIERKRPGRGKFVLMIGCLGAVYAVAVGLRLYLGHGVAPAAGED